VKGSSKRLLTRACRLVGRFQYHFARVEQKVDQGVIKLLDLDAKAAPIVTGNLDFAKKLNLVRTAAYQQAAKDDKQQQFGEDTCKAVFKINDVRQLVIHSSFEPGPGGGVQFKRTVAKNGRLRIEDQVWGDKEFHEHYRKMVTLEGNLDNLIRLIKPVPSSWRFNPSTESVTDYVPIAMKALQDAYRRECERGQRQ
jgi:hypothetical protein